MSFEVEEGEFFGILGPNGAGKTTAAVLLGIALVATVIGLRLFKWDDA